MTDGGSRKIESIQALRGIAALLIVFWHASQYFGPYGTGWAGALCQPGANMGVDLFFLISGFIMVVTTGTGRRTPRDAARFIIRRFARIWPPYAIATLLLLAIIPGRAAPYLTPSGLSHLMQALFFIPVAGADGGPPVFGFPPLQVGWTLNYEMYFYTIFAVSLLFGRARWIAFAAWLAITLLAIPHTLAPDVGILLNPHASYGFQGYLAIMTSPMMLLFAGGVVIGLLYESPLQIRNVFVLNLALFLTVSFTVFQYTAWIRVEHGITNWGISLVPLLLVVSLASKTLAIRVPGPLAYLGDISFSLYILHPVVREAFHHGALFLGHIPPSGFPAFFFTTTLSIAAAAISHRYLELRLSGSFRDLLLQAVPGNRARRGPATARQCIAPHTRDGNTAD